MTTKHIISSLLHYVSTNYSTTAVRWPGVPGAQGMDLDTRNTGEWIDVYLLALDKDAQRAGHEHARPMVQVNVFSRVSTNFYRVHEIVDAVKTLLERACISVQDFATGGEPEVGKLRLREAQVADLGEVEPGSGLYQIAVTFSGRVEALA